MKKLALLLVLIVPVFTFSQIINIPEDSPSIQKGIDVASSGDTVLVANGIYYENINFKGKAITLASYYLIDENDSHIDSTIIDVSQVSNPDSAYAVYFVNNEDTTSVLAGFTLKYSTRELSASGAIIGGGFFLQNASPKMYQNKIIGQILVKQDPKTFLTWVYLNDPPKKMRGSLYMVNDSSVSFIEGITLEQNSKIGFEPPLIYFDQIKVIKIRRDKSIKRGVFAGMLSGIVAGVVVGSVLGRVDTKYKRVNQTSNAAIAVGYGALFGLGGAAIGAAIGSIKISFSIKHDKAKFDHNKEKMKRYTVTYE